MAEIIIISKENDSPRENINLPDEDILEGVKIEQGDEQLTSDINVETPKTDEETPLLNVGLSANRFQTLLEETVEELRLRRAAEEETKINIKQLNEDRDSYEVKYEASMADKLRTESEFREKNIRLEKQFNIMEQDVQLEKEKYIAATEAYQNESKSLKEEIKTLQQGMHVYEKKFKDQDRSLEKCASRKTKHLTQLSSIEENLSDLKITIVHSQDDIIRMEANVKEAVKINTSLRKVIDGTRTEMSDGREREKHLKRKLRLCKLKLESLPTTYQQQISDKEEVIDKLQDEITQKIAAFRRQEAEIVRIKDDKEAVESLLCEAHRLIEFHVEENTKLQEDNKDNQQHHVSIKNELDTTRTELSEKTKELRIEKEVFQVAIEKWKEKEVDLKKRFSALESERGELKSSVHEMEEVNREWNRKHSQSREQVLKLQDVINRPKNAKQTQTEREMKESSAQTDICVLSQSTQTTVASTNTACQISPENASVSSQWDVLSLVDSTQTDTPCAVVDSSVPVQHEFLRVSPERADQQSQTCIAFSQPVEQSDSLGGELVADDSTKETRTPTSVEEQHIPTQGGDGIQSTQLVCEENTSVNKETDDSEPQQPKRRKLDTKDSIHTPCAPTSPTEASIHGDTNPDDTLVDKPGELEGTITKQEETSGCASHPMVPAILTDSRAPVSRATRTTGEDRRVRFSPKLEQTPPTSQETDNRRQEAWSRVGAGRGMTRLLTVYAAEQEGSVSPPAMEHGSGDDSLFSEDEDTIELGSQVDKIDKLLIKSEQITKRLCLQRKK